jgi:ATP-dependent Clp protease ATP-binding subunit ClpC
MATQTTMAFSSLGASPVVAPGARGLRRSRAPPHRTAAPQTQTPRAMFSNFDGTAVTAVKDGMGEAKKLRSGELKTEHLLLALSKVRDDTSSAMHKAGATEDALRKAIAKRGGISELELFNPFSNTKVADGLIPLGADVKRLFERVALTAENALGDTLVGSKELVLDMLNDTTCGARAVLVEDLEIDLSDLRDRINGMEKKELVGAGKKLGKKNKGSALQECGIDLCAEARAGKLDPVLGRDAEVDRILRILVSISHFPNPSDCFPIQY